MAARDLVLDAGVLAPLLRRLVPEEKIGFLRNATWALLNFCRGKPAPPFRKLRDSLPTLASLISAEDENVLEDALWALSFISDSSDGDRSRLSAVVEARILPRIVELLGHANTKVATPAVHMVGIVVTGDVLQTQAVLDAGALPRLLALMQHEKLDVRREATWAVSNIMAGSQAQIQAALDAGAVPELVQHLQTGEWEVKKEACWALSNATSGGSAAQIAFLVGEGVVGPLAKMLEIEDARLVKMVLQGLSSVG